MARKTTTSGIKLDRRTLARLRVLSRAKQRSQHWLMKEAIGRYLDEEEDAERVKRETLERWASYEATGEHVSARLMKAWVETWGTAQERPWPRAGA